MMMIAVDLIRCYGSTNCAVTIYHLDYMCSEVFRVQVYPRHEFKLEPVDNSLSDINYFRVDGLDNTTVSIKVARSLEDLVDRVFLTIQNNKSVFDLPS
ncbi:uncharacterized protein TNCV_1052901 [Trichonephila clavipes]|nr:uncharacterized protein TNCV_1052901 [Trichonephila clavipes]